MGQFTKFARIAETEFGSIVLSTQHLDRKLRIYLRDKSYIDFYFTTLLKKRKFTIHWERRHLDNTIHRLDNTPDRRWQKVDTFPLHIHSKQYENVIEPPFRVDHLSLGDILRSFLQFVEGKIK